MATVRPETVPEALWRRFTAGGVPATLRAGTFLWTPGDDVAGSSYLVTTGLMRLYHPTSSGQVVTLLAVGAGGFLGYRLGTDDQAHITGAEALTDAALLTLRPEQVAHWLGGQDEVGRAFLGWLYEDLLAQLSDTQLRLGLEHSSAAARVAHALLALDRQSLLSRMSRAHIAELSNLSVETTVRTISQFVSEGRLERSRFVNLSEAERLALADLLEPYALSLTPSS